ncbi:MAG: hypothetical protein MR727_13235 [Lentisphaeria bacterium]|nr:hypothetical protein [Lentisphaeria bacterium]
MRAKSRSKAKSKDRKIESVSVFEIHAKRVFFCSPPAVCVAEGGMDVYYDDESREEQYLFISDSDFGLCISVCKKSFFDDVAENKPNETEDIIIVEFPTQKAALQSPYREAFKKVLKAYKMI